MIQKIFDEVVQEILETSMIVGIGEASEYNTGRIRGHQDALDIITKIRHSREA